MLYGSLHCSCACVLSGSLIFVNQILSNFGQCAGYLIPLLAWSQWGAGTYTGIQEEKEISTFDKFQRTSKTVKKSSTHLSSYLQKEEYLFPCLYWSHSLFLLDSIRQHISDSKDFIRTHLMAIIVPSIRASHKHHPGFSLFLILRFFRCNVTQTWRAAIFKIQSSTTCEW